MKITGTWAKHIEKSIICFFSGKIIKRLIAAVSGDNDLFRNKFHVTNHALFDIFCFTPEKMAVAFKKILLVTLELKKIFQMLFYFL